MCSICGVVNFADAYEKTDIVLKMNKAMKHRGPDASDIFNDKNACLGHNRLCVVDIENGKQPMSVMYGNKKYTIVYNGEIYNCDELRAELQKQGFELTTTCDTEVVLLSYILYGESVCDYLNGIFAFCVYDGEKIFCARDRFGVKPFYYALRGNDFIFASEIKAMLSHPKISAKIEREGLWELLYLSPNFISGKSVFCDISELDLAQCLVFDKKGLRKRTYWRIEAQQYFKDREHAIEKTRFLVSDAIKRQLVSDVPLCSLLSGGLDSSVVSAIASEEYRNQGKILDTYSFEYEGNKESFEKSLFQPEKDDDFAILASRYLKTDHTVLTAPTSEVAKRLFDATLCRDLPGQADIDSSLHYFCERIKERHTVGLSGECSDEIFGGYPWFYRPEMLYSDFFPWIHSPRLRPSLFKGDVANSDTGYAKMRDLYKATLNECPTLKSDSPTMKASRIASYLSVKFFMSSLLQRKDRMSMASGLEIRVPFADHRIFEFVFNVPWEIKFEGGVEKALLRNAMVGKLPDCILWRKKSPYPKTHNPEYLKAVRKMLDSRLSSNGFLKEFLDTERLDEILSSNSTWFGQLMGGAQLVAWLIQFDIWMKEYNIDINI
ncbi:MAG: asparagine synthase (glutamine-hydrolyzing) [Clostridia bacterium]|nr:asparagine synthase (glutamine-hydrolyzing) [Clostridia bacterium]